MNSGMNYLAIVLYLFTAFGLGYFLLKGREMYQRISAGQSDPARFLNKGERAKVMAKEILLHTRMLRFTGSAIAHWFVMIGFVALLGTLITAYGQLLNASFVLPIIGNWAPYRYFVLGISWATGISIVALIGIRLATKFFYKSRTSRFLGSRSLKAYYVEATILVIVICVITLDYLEHQYYVNGTTVQIVAGIKILVSVMWFVVIANDLTMGVAWHRFLAPFNIFFKRNLDSTPALGELPEMISHGQPINFEDPKEDDVFGIGKSADISWKGLLDMASCTECGRCQSQCPAWHTDKPLSPKLLIMAMRDHALSNLSSDEKIVGEIISPEVLWSCTMCGACVNECPVDIEHIDHIVNMRRFQVLVESEFPSELGGTFRNLEKTGNPWGSNRADRNGWIAECDFPVTLIENEIPEDIEYLFWVGCAGAYEERAKKTTKAVAELLYMSGTTFGVLGQRETCTGDPARRSGNEFLYQILSRENIETLQQTFGSRGVKKVVVTCPHCFTTIGRDYKQQGFELQMVHHTQLLNQLIKEGKLKTSPHKSGATLTYHDPCYLGRHNQIYQPPRELLESTGIEITEMPRNQDRSFCCGAGGGRMWMEETIGTRINLNRVDEAIATQVKEVAVACPFCRIMVSDGMTARESDIGVLDVAQVLLRNIKG
ncbi:MAG: (Fe-S)-binding protein [Actinomycetes bacterium]